MKKQTAVEWLVAEIKSQLIAQVPELDLRYLEEQAKAMEKEQKLQFARAYLSCHDMVDKIKELEKTNKNIRR